MTHYVTVEGFRTAVCSCGWARDGRTLAGAREAAADHERQVMGLSDQPEQEQ